MKDLFCLSSSIKLDFDVIALLIRTIISDLTPHFIADIFLTPPPKRRNEFVDDP